MYAVLQKSLDQVIPIAALEDAVRATQELAKPDCPQLQRDLFGIVAGNLSEEEARGMQTALRGRGVETDVVDESELPALPTPKRAQSFTISSAGLRAVEFAAVNETLIPADRLTFAAAGQVLHLTTRPHEQLE